MRYYWYIIKIYKDIYHATQYVYMYIGIDIYIYIYYDVIPGLNPLTWAVEPGEKGLTYGP